MEAIAGAGGLLKVELRSPEGARAEVYLHGAHLSSWVPAGGSEAIFLSKAAKFGPAYAIRGGIPVVFPQFSGLGPLPKHGFARTQAWEIAGSGSPAQVTLALRDSALTRGIWPHAFLAELSIEIAGQRLAARLSILNTDKAPFGFSAALHSYLRVADVERARLSGLQGVKYRNREPWDEIQTQAAEELSIAGEVDRVFMDSPPSLRLVDPVPGRTMRISQKGFRDTVVWNPGRELAADLSEFEPSEYREMLCVEAAQVMHPVALPPGQRWEGRQEVEIEQDSNL